MSLQTAKQNPRCYRIGDFLRSNYKIIKETTRYAFNLKFLKIPNKTYLHSMK